MRSTWKAAIAALVSVAATATMGIAGALPARADVPVQPISGMALFDAYNDGYIRVWFVTPPDYSSLTPGLFKVMMDISTDPTFATTDILDNYDLTSSANVGDNWGIEWGNNGSPEVPNAQVVTVRMWIEVFDGVNPEPIYSTPHASVTGSSTTTWGPLSAARKKLAAAVDAHTSAVSTDRCPSCTLGYWDVYPNDVDGMNTLADQLDADSAANFSGYLGDFERDIANGLEFHPGDWRGIFEYVDARLQYIHPDSARAALQTRVDALLAAADARLVAVQDSWTQRDAALAAFDELWSNGESTEARDAVPGNRENYQTADLVAKTSALKARNLELAAARVAAFNAFIDDSHVVYDDIAVISDDLIRRLNTLPQGSDRTALLGEVTTATSTAQARVQAARAVEVLITGATTAQDWAAAKAAYDAMPQGAAAYVNNYSALEVVINQMAADAVTALITAKSWFPARTAYNALTPAQKELVSNYSQLTEEESARATAVTAARAAMTAFVDKGGRNTAAAYLAVKSAIAQGSTASSKSITDATKALVTATNSLPVAPEMKTAPVVTGTAKVGKKLTVSAGTWTGKPTPSTSYQWYACTSKPASATRLNAAWKCVAITKATASTFTITSAEVGMYLLASVTGTNSAGAVTYFAGYATKAS